MKYWSVESIKAAYQEIVSRSFPKKKNGSQYLSVSRRLFFVSYWYLFLSAKCCLLNALFTPILFTAQLIDPEEIVDSDINFFTYSGEHASDFGSSMKMFCSFIDNELQIKVSKIGVISWRNSYQIALLIMNHSERWRDVMVNDRPIHYSLINDTGDRIMLPHSIIDGIISRMLEP